MYRLLIVCVGVGGLIIGCSSSPPDTAPDSERAHPAEAADAVTAVDTGAPTQEPLPGISYPLTPQEYDFATTVLPHTLIENVRDLNLVDPLKAMEKEIIKRNMGTLYVSTSAVNQSDRTNLLFKLMTPDEPMVKQLEAFPVQLGAHQVVFKEGGAHAFWLLPGDSGLSHTVIVNEDIFNPRPLTLLSKLLGLSSTGRVPAQDMSQMPTVFDAYTACQSGGVDFKTLLREQAPDFLSRVNRKMRDAFARFSDKLPKSIRGFAKEQLVNFDVLRVLPIGYFEDFLNENPMFSSFATQLAPLQYKQCVKQIYDSAAHMARLYNYAHESYSHATGLTPTELLSLDVGETAFHAEMIAFDPSLKVREQREPGYWIRSSEFFSPQDVWGPESGVHILFTGKEFHFYGKRMLESSQYMLNTLQIPLQSPEQMIKAIGWVKARYPGLRISRIYIIAEADKGTLIFNNLERVTASQVEEKLGAMASRLGVQDRGLIVWLDTVLLARDQGEFIKTFSDVVLKNVPESVVISSDQDKWQWKNEIALEEFPLGYLQHTVKGNVWIYPKDANTIYLKRPLTLTEP